MSYTFLSQSIGHININKMCESSTLHRLHMVCVDRCPHIICVCVCPWCCLRSPLASAYMLTLVPLSWLALEITSLWSHAIMLTIDGCLRVGAIMLTRYLSLSISAAVPLRRQATRSSKRVGQQRVDRCWEPWESWELFVFRWNTSPWWRSRCTTYGMKPWSDV